MAQTVKLEDGQQEVELVVDANNPLAWVDINGLGLLVQAIRRLHNGLFEMEFVRFDITPHITLEIRLIDGRRGLYTFSSLALDTYTLSIDTGYWKETETLALVDIRRALQSLHKEFPLISFLWEKKV